MLRLKGFGVRNLRALHDTGIIDLKPITILVGKNSAGKSSFARILPLLKQSAEKRKQGPLLWFGRLVDFGSFSETVSSFSDAGEIDLLLRFSTPQALFLSRRSRGNEAETNLSQADIDVQLKLTSEGDEGRTILKELSIDIFGVNIKITVESSRDIRIIIDGIPVIIPNEIILRLGQGNILPLIRLIYKSEISTNNLHDSIFFQTQRREKLGTKSLRSAISSFVHGNTLTERKDEIADRLPLSSLKSLLENCLKLTGVPDTWRTNFLDLTPASNRLKALQRALILNKLDVLLIELDEAIQMFCVGVSYLEPLRATAQRFYRREEVSIDELDPKGLNTTFFLQGLASRERDSLNVG